MRQLLLAVTLSLAATCLAAPVQAQTQTQPQPTLPDPSESPSRDLGQDLFTRSGSTALVFVIVHGGKVTFQSYGETAPGSGTRPTPDSLLRLCSLSKIFATDLLVKLASDPQYSKAVRLDTPLQALAPPGHHVPGPELRPITLGDLATHTAGLPREITPTPRGSEHFTFPSYAQRWAWLPSQHLKTTPGTAAAYSNIGFDLLGDALQQAAGVPYAQLLADRTTTPLGMRETTLSPSPAQCARLLLGVHKEGHCTDTQNSASSAGVYSTGTDMARFLQYLLGTGLPTIPAQNPAAQAVYLQPASLTGIQGLDHATQPIGLGLGWVHGAPDGTDEIIQKTGGGAGFLTYIALSQPTHTAIFVAATDGLPETHLNLFHAANNVLQVLAGLPPLPPDPIRTVAAPRPHRTPAVKATRAKITSKPALKTTAKRHSTKRKTS